MHFVTALLALAACYGSYRYFWSNADFKSYVTSLNPQYGSKAIIGFWVSVVFAVWGLLINDSAPASLSLLFSAATGVAFLVSPPGEKFLKDLWG